MMAGAARVTVERFQLLRVVTVDAWGTLFEAIDPECDQALALRVFPAPTEPPGDEAQARIRDASVAAVALEHPNIAVLHACGWHRRTPFAASVWVDGETLPQYLARVGRLPAWQALAMAAQMLAALQAAHAAGLFHGAVHPDHLWVGRTGQVKVLGFVWAAAAARPAPADVAPYVAPEQRLGHPKDHRADLYAAAVIAYQLLTGDLPFPPHGIDPDRQDTQVPRSVRAARAELPAELDAVFLRALALRPESRYPDAHAFLAALQAALGMPVWDRSRRELRLPPRVESAAPPIPPTSAAVPMPRPRAQVEDAPTCLDRAELALAACCAAMLMAAAGWLVGVPPRGGAAPAGTAAERAGRAPEPQQPAAAAPVPRVAVARASPAASAPVALRAEAPPAAANQEPAGGRNQHGRPVALAAATPSPVPSKSRAAARHRGERATAVEPAPPRAQLHRLASSGAPAELANSDLDCREASAIARELCVVVRCATTEFRRHPLCMQLHAEGSARKRQAEALGGR